MKIEQAIRDECYGAAAIAALVIDRIYYVRAPQDVLKPYIVFSKVSAPRDNTHDGPSGLVNARFQFDCYATTYMGAKAIAAAVQSELEGYSGTMGGAGGVLVNGCFYDDEQDNWDEETKFYCVTQDFVMWYRE